MNKKSYENYFTEEQLSNLKASEIKEFQGQEKALAWLIIIVAMGLFVTFVLSMAFILWTNKLTIFLLTVALLPTILLCIVTVRSLKGFTKSINNYKKTAESREIE